MAIEAIKIEDLVDVAQDVNCDLVALANGKDKAKAAHEYTKLFPAIQKGEINNSVIRRFGLDEQEKAKARGEDITCISQPTLTGWKQKLEAGEEISSTRSASTSSDAPATTSTRGRKAGSTSAKISIPRAEYEELKEGFGKYWKLKTELEGSKLVSEADALVIASIKTHQPDLYDGVLMGVRKEEEARIRADVEAKYKAMMEQELAQKLAAFQPLNVEAPESGSKKK